MGGSCLLCSNLTIHASINTVNAPIYWLEKTELPRVMPRLLKVDLATRTGVCVFVSVFFFFGSSHR